MKKRKIFQISIYGIISIFFFSIGILGLIFFINQFNNLRELSKSGIAEKAVVTKISRKAKSKEVMAIYFVTEKEDKTYKNLFRTNFPGEIKVGEEIEVKFNKDRTLFLITNYSTSIYSSYISIMVIFGICLLLAILSALAALQIFKERNYSNKKITKEDIQLAIEKLGTIKLDKKE